MGTTTWPDSLLDDLAQLLTLDDLMGQSAWFDTEKRTAFLLDFDPEDELEPLDDDAPTWQREEHAKAEAVLAEPARYRYLPALGNTGRLREFLHGISDPDLYDALVDAKAGGRGAYRRVRDELERRGQEQLWYDFNEAADRELARDWLAREGLTP